MVHTHEWDSIENKPLTFPPKSHAHHWDTVTNKPASATRWPTFNEVTGKPASATRWPKYSEVTEKPALGSAAERNVGLDSGDLMEVGAFGWGARGSVSHPSDNINDPSTPSGAYRVDPETRGDLPPGFSDYGVLIVTRLNSLQSAQLYIDATGETATRFYDNAAEAWQGWRIGLNKKNTLNAELYGVGEIAPTKNGNENTGNGFFRNAGGEGWFSDTATQFPYVQASRSTIGETVCWQFGASVGGSDGNNQAIFQGRVTSANSGDFGEIVTFAHSGNSNFDTFGGGDSNEKLASGFAKFSNFAVFEPKLSFVTSARSIEVSGTFKIIDKVNGNTIIDGINGLSLLVYSSNKEWIVVFNAGASLFTKGQELELLSSTSGAYFKVGQ